VSVPTPTVLVVVHGAPGSGKSTLARALGTELGLPVFDRDDFKDVMFDVLGWSDRDWSLRVGAASWEMLRLCIDRLLRQGVSLLAESNFRPADDLVKHLRGLCDKLGVVCIEVHCTARDETLWERFEGRRQAGARHAGHVGFEEREIFLADLRARPHGRLGLGDVVLELDTTDAWPDAAGVATRIRTTVGSDELVTRRRTRGPYWQ